MLEFFQNISTAVIFKQLMILQNLHKIARIYVVLSTILLKAMFRLKIHVIIYSTSFHYYISHKIIILIS